MGSAFSDAPPPPPIHRLIKDFLASLRHRFHPPPVPSSNPMSPSRHYSIRYLAPNNPVAPGINRAQIPDLRLLPGNRIDYFGQPIPIDKFPSSPLPFSVGH